MTGNQTIIYCNECKHCFENRRSGTGYSCEVWGYEDFACSVPLSGFCHKAKAKQQTGPKVSSDDLRKLKGE